MHNLLTGSLPRTVTIRGREFFAETDFRTMIAVEKQILDSCQNAEDRVKRILQMIYTPDMPQDVEAALKGIIYLDSCGKPPEVKKSEPKKKRNGQIDIKEKLIYDYEFDAPYIYGAFLSQYGIDLQDVEYLHWWKFQALFKSLPSTQKIVEIMGYRATDATQIKNNRERARIQRLQNIYALPQNLTTEEKVAMAGAAFCGGFTK